MLIFPLFSVDLSKTLVYNLFIKGVDMNRNDLAKALAKQAKLSLDDAEKLIVSFTDTITDVLQKKEKVIYSNFGTFYTVHYPSKVIYHPVLGKKKQMVMLPTDAVKWMPSGNIKELVQTSQEVESATAFGATKKHKEENRKAGIAEIKARELTDDEILAQENIKKLQEGTEEEEYIIPIRVTTTKKIEEPVEISSILTEEIVSIPISVQPASEPKIEATSEDLPAINFENLEADLADHILITAETSPDIFPDNSLAIDTAKITPAPVISLDTQDLEDDSQSFDLMISDLSQARKKNIAFVDLEEIEIPEESFALLPKEIIRNFRVLPLSIEPDHIVVAMTHPDDRETIKMIERLLGKKISPRLSSTGDIEKYLKKFELTKNEVLPEIEIPEDESPTSAYLTLSDSSSPMVRLVNLIIARAVRENASEIHFEPVGNEVTMKYHVDRTLKLITTFPKDIAVELIAKIKMIGQMDSTTHLPQSGYFKQKYSGYTLRFYVSTLPIADGEKIVIKITNKMLELRKLDELGLLGNDLQLMSIACQRLHGLILISGPKGSGISTTYYSMLNETYFDGANIVSLENPIECKVNGINQSEIDEPLGYTFEAGVDSVLKQDPDVLAVSEITSKKITSRLIKSSTAGRMVIATLEANSLDEALKSLLSAGLEPTLVFSAINTIVNQRLARKLCNYCKTELPLTDEQKKSVRAEVDKMPAVERELLRKNGTKFYQGTGCNRCHHTGFKGQIGLFEFLKLPATTKRESLAKFDSAKMKNLIYNHTVNLTQDGILKASLGLTSIEEVLNIGKNK
jgi:type IV pilus assembly protein PilB